VIPVLAACIMALVLFLFGVMLGIAIGGGE
jgi:hypothetical protein